MFLERKEIALNQKLNFFLMDMILIFDFI